jgi:hypothetical protein
VLDPTPTPFVCLATRSEMTLANRFVTASSEGVLVDYEIWDAGFTRKLMSYDNGELDLDLELELG